MKTKKTYNTTPTIVTNVWVNDEDWYEWFQVKAGNTMKLIVENVYDTDTITYSGTL